MHKINYIIIRNISVNVFSSVIVRQLAFCTCVCMHDSGSTSVSETQKVKRIRRKAPRSHSTETPLCLLMCLAKIFTIGLVARNRNNTEASAQRQYPLTREDFGVCVTIVRKLPYV